MGVMGSEAQVVVLRNEPRVGEVRAVGDKVEEGGDGSGAPPPS